MPLMSGACRNIKQEWRNTNKFVRTNWQRLHTCYQRSRPWPLRHMWPGLGLGRFAVSYRPHELTPASPFECHTAAQTPDKTPSNHTFMVIHGHSSSPCISSSSSWSSFSLFHCGVDPPRPEFHRLGGSHSTSRVSSQSWTAWPLTQDYPLGLLV